jgi:hypothetical protein
MSSVIVNFVPLHPTEKMPMSGSIALRILYLSARWNAHLKTGYFSVTFLYNQYQTTKSNASVQWTGKGLESSSCGLSEIPFQYSAGLRITTKILRLESWCLVRDSKAAPNVCESKAIPKCKPTQYQVLNSIFRHFKNHKWRLILKNNHDHK